MGGRPAWCGITSTARTCTPVCCLSGKLLLCLLDCMVLYVPPSEHLGTHSSQAQRLPAGIPVRGTDAHAARQIRLDDGKAVAFSWQQVVLKGWSKQICVWE